MNRLSCHCESATGGRGNLILIASSLALLAMTCVSSQTYAAPKQFEFTRTQILMGDVPVILSIRAKENKKQAAFAAMGMAFATAEKIENSVSEFKPASSTTKLNKNSGQWIRVDQSLLAILKTSFVIHQQTGGAFDPTFASAGKDFSLRDVELSARKNRVCIKDGVKLGFSAIAKGYIVDHMGKTLQKKGFKNYLINAGGDVLAKGDWTIGINKSPCTLNLKNAAISTSGSYERGRHIINPQTKKPADHFLSVSVIAKSSMMADGLATGLYVLPLPKVEEIQSHNPGLTVVVVNHKNRIAIFGEHAIRCEDKSVIASEHSERSNLM